MALSSLPAQRPFGVTTRPDAWWLQPLLVFLGFSAFIVYSTWAAFQGVSDMKSGTCSYWFGGNGANYLSPFYSPEFWGTSPHAIFGATLPSWFPAWAPFSPAFLILWIPAGFRFTCYYYRGAYYKAFWADPINCAVGEPRKTFLGENPSRSSSKMSTATFFIWQCCLSSCFRMMHGKECGLTTENILASASARLC